MCCEFEILDRKRRRSRREQNSVALCAGPRVANRAIDPLAATWRDVCVADTAAVDRDLNDQRRGAVIADSADGGKRRPQLSKRRFLRHRHEQLPAACGHGRPHHFLPDRSELCICVWGDEPREDRSDKCDPDSLTRKHERLAYRSRRACYSLPGFRQTVVARRL